LRISDNHPNPYDVALATIIAVRDIEGPDVKGVGPDIDKLKAQKYMGNFDDLRILAGAKRAFLHLAANATEELKVPFAALCANGCFSVMCLTLPFRKSVIVRWQHLYRTEIT
jgi:hypothetical protein